MICSILFILSIPLVVFIITIIKNYRDTKDKDLYAPIPTPTVFSGEVKVFILNKETVKVHIRTVKVDNLTIYNKYEHNVLSHLVTHTVDGFIINATEYKDEYFSIANVEYNLKRVN